MLIRHTNFDFDNCTYVMGILNATPDSFSDGGKYYVLDKAIEHGLEMVEKGATIIDIGGESTRPNFEPVSEEDEIERVVPVIEGIRAKSDVVISIDTTKAEVARRAVLAGADIINDVSGLLLDKNMGKVIKDTGAICVLMHDGNYFKDDARWSEVSYTDKVIAQLDYIAQNAIEAGIEKDKIILDPGIGFGKTTEENLILLNNMASICAMNYPMLLGCSRKSVIGNTLGLPVNERVEGTIVTSILGVQAGAGIVRVHDVVENLRAIEMLGHIRRSGR